VGRLAIARQLSRFRVQHAIAEPRTLSDTHKKPTDLSRIGHDMRPPNVRRLSPEGDHSEGGAMRRDSTIRLRMIGAVLAMLLGTDVAMGEASNVPVSRMTELALTRTAGLPVTIRMAVLEARRRLDDPRCRLIFLEFEDPSGHALQQRLDEMGQSGQSYLEWMLFYDGQGGRACRDANVMAMTDPGSRVVFYCGQRFASLLRRDLGTLADVVLHEELHSLGLMENPPSSREITQSVTRRCGR
jgi:hypothetical protein